MKNVFYLIIDAFCYNNLNRKIGNEFTTPFLRKLANEHTSIENMYSQAPYTEAALVSLLSGENTLERGGYLYGNKTVQNTIFRKYKNENYNIISQYAPYVYSKAYLKDVDVFFYTRLVNIEVLFNYRLSYYRTRYKKQELTNQELEVCIALLREELETWITQTEDLLANKECCTLIKNWVCLENISEVHDKLKKEYLLFNNLPAKYIYNLFNNFDTNNLLNINRSYNEKNSIKNTDLLIEKYQSMLIEVQKKYNKIIKKDWPEWRYLFSTFFNKDNGFRDLKGLIHNYIRYYNNSFLESYIDSIDESSIVEVGMKRQLDYVLDLVDDSNNNGKPAFVYLQVQDFHLPTKFHSADYDDLDYVKREFEEALSLCKHIDDNYKGNILADLGARFCDSKIRELFNVLKSKYGDDFTLIISADHGYPSFFNPPRPYIYNQTYTEAFHIPFIIVDCDIKAKLSGFFSTMDFSKIVESKGRVKGREYILTEYAGPGCPHISEKPIWYTYIDLNYRLSVELMLGSKIDYGNIRSLYDLSSDPNEKINLVKQAHKISEVKRIMEIINNRNAELSAKFSGEKFLNFLNTNITYDQDNL